MILTIFSILTNIRKISSLSVIFEPEKLSALRTDSMFILKVNSSLRAVLYESWRLWLINSFGRMGSWRFFFVSMLYSGTSLMSGLWVRPHYFILFLQTRFIDFFMFELTFKRNNIIEGRYSVSWDVLLASLPKLEVALFPKIAFLLSLFKLIVSSLKIVQEHSGFRDESMDDLLESSRIFFIETTIEKLLFFHL